MLSELELARSHLARQAGVAQAIRRLCGLEWAPRRGYRSLPRARMRRMEQIARVPKGVDKFHVLWTDPAQGTATIEWSDGERCYYATVPMIAVRRFDRQAGRRRNG